MKRVAFAIMSLLLVVLLLPVAMLAPDPAHADLEATESSLVPQGDSSAVTDISRMLSRTLGTKERTVPPVQDFHEAFGVTDGYPAYNQNFDTALANKGVDVGAQKAAVLAEDNELLDYTSMDAAGNLYKDGVLKEEAPDGRTVTKLVRHTAGVANYGETIPDEAASTTKRLSLRMQRYGNVVTGLYAAPGEVVKITLNGASNGQDPASLGLQVFIGNFGGNAERVEIPDDRVYVRMPKQEKMLALSATENYVGSPFGGAILIYSKNIGGTSIDMTIEGAVEMPTYTYGETSDEEFARQLQAPGPYFAFTTPRGLRAVGPASLVRNLSVSQLKKAMEFWDKAIGLSYQFEAGSFDSTNPDTNLMVEMFEPYIPAGAAVNMGNYCICPVSWGSGFFDADGIIKSGAWGQIHELNHSFPWGGAIDGMTEISNNVINALTYQLYTNIAATRTEPTSRDNPGSGGLAGWNWTSDLYTTVERLRLNVEAAKAGTSDPFTRWNLQVYVPLQHAYGADRFINAVHLYHEKGGKYNKKLVGNELYTNSNVWMVAASEASGYNLGYYMRDIQGFPEYAGLEADKSDYITSDVRNALVDVGPVYIPSGCLYASGLVYDQADGTDSPTGNPAVVAGKGSVSAPAFEGGKEVVEMGRAFRIPFGAVKTLDFKPSTEGGYVSVANGESVQMVGYTQPAYGSLAPTSDGLKLAYTPNTNHLEDYFYVTLRLTVTDLASPYVGATQNVTFKVSLTQETGGFTTTSYTWSNPSNVARGSAVVYAVEHGALDQQPVSVSTAAVAGFDSATEGALAVTEGKVYIPKTGAVDLYVRGNYWFNTCVAASAAELPGVADAQSKRDWPVGGDGSKYDTTAQTTRISVYVVPSGGSAPANASSYAAVVNEGAPLYVRAYELVNGSGGRFRIGYLDGGDVKEFGSGEILATEASVDNVTPTVSSYETEKLYSYPDPAAQETEIDGDFQAVGEPLSVKRVWDLTRGQELEARGNVDAQGKNPTSMVDDLTELDTGGYPTQFHSYISSTDYAAEFVFELDSVNSFNTIRFKGHNNPGASFVSAGKIKDYEVYVGNDYDELLTAGPDSPLFVTSGTTATSNNFGDFNRIDLGRTVQGKYVRLVSRSVHPRNGQYYYTISDFRVGNLESISGEGTISTSYDTSDGWRQDDAFINTRAELMTTETGTGTFQFEGSGVIMYAATGPDYGSMIVTLDGVEKEVNLTSTGLCGQQAVFWKSGLGEGVHTLEFRPKQEGADRINVEYFEVKEAQSSESGSGSSKPLKLSVQLQDSRFTYTGSPIEPAVTVTLGDKDVTADASIAYENNTNAGIGVVAAVYEVDGASYSDAETFDIMKASYPEKMTAMLSGGATGYTYGQSAAIPRPLVANTPENATVTFYYSNTDPGDLSEELSGDGLAGGEVVGTVWDQDAMTSTTLEPETYYLWAVASSPNYSDVASAPITFTVEDTGHVHDWGTPTYEWSADNMTVTASAVCQLDSSHTITRTAKSTYAVTVAPTTTSAGEGTYTAKFTSGPFTTQTKTVEIPALVQQPFEVMLDAGEGTVDPATLTVYSGVPYGTLPVATRDGWQFDGWYTAATGGTEVTSSTVVTATEPYTLYAHWAPAATVEGRVLAGTVVSGGTPIKNARVELRYGTQLVQVLSTNNQGGYSFPNVAYDVYNLVVIAEIDGTDRTVTTMVNVNDATVSGSVVDAGNLYIPEKTTNSVLAFSGDVPDIVVGGLDTLARTLRINAEQEAVASDLVDDVSAVTVTMTVSEADEWTSSAAQHVKELVKTTVGRSDDIGVDFFDMSLEQTVSTVMSSSAANPGETRTETTAITNSPEVLTLAAPFDFSGRTGVSVYRYHNGQTSIMEKLDVKPLDPVDGAYYADESSGLVYIYTSEFSLYAIGYEETQNDSCDHEWGPWELTKAPTCTEPGIETRVCLLDSTHTESREVAPLGHDWGPWTVTQQPAVGVPGVETRVCKNDPSHVETRAIPALPDPGSGDSSSSSSSIPPKQENASVRTGVGGTVAIYASGRVAVVSSGASAPLTEEERASLQKKPTSDMNVIDGGKEVLNGDKTLGDRLVGSNSEAVISGIAGVAIALATGMIIAATIAVFILLAKRRKREEEAEKTS